MSMSHLSFLSTNRYAWSSFPLLPLVCMMRTFQCTWDARRECQVFYFLVGQLLLSRAAPNDAPLQPPPVLMLSSLPFDP